MCVCVVHFGGSYAPFSFYLQGCVVVVAFVVRSDHAGELLCAATGPPSSAPIAPAVDSLAHRVPPAVRVAFTTAGTTTIAAVAA